MMVKITFQLLDLYLRHPPILTLRHTISEHNDVIKRLRSTVELIILVCYILNENKQVQKK